MQVEPFLKWAGGKRWFANNHINLLPKEFNSYIEPFLGSGALFFKLAPEKGVLADVNPELINVYISIRDNWSGLIERLAEHQLNHSSEYYYEIRSCRYLCPFDQAAQFIYLNRTCWNGLYRVNRKGEFNVPIGTKSSVLLDTDDFHAISALLSDVELLAEDFEHTISRAGEGDFVFVDPPYTVKHNFNGFVKYNEKLFSWADQIRLRDAVDSAVSRGAFVLVTNADHPSVRKLYSKFGKKKKISRHSVLSGNANYRGPVSELVVRSWL